MITTKTAYDDNSRVTSRKDDKDNTTSYAYDHRNRKITETFADSTSRSWTYDKDSHLLTWTDQRGVVCTMDKNADIDALGRVLKATYTLTTGVSGTTVQTFDYDGLSRLKTATDNNQAGTSDDSVYYCTFDSLSRCAVELQAIGEVSGEVASVYDANSNLTSLTYPRKLGGGSRVISYSYDNLDRVNSVDEGAAQLASYSFFGPGRINHRKYRPAATSPMTTSYSYDAVRRVTNIEHSNLLQPNGSTGLTLNFDYAFDREGSVIAEHATHEGSSGSTQRGLDFYSYDSAYRLTKEFRGVPGTLPSNNIATNPTFTGTASDDRAWTLDGVTNWKSYIDSLNGVATTTTRAVNTVNEYGSVTVGMGTPVSRTHDNNGNLTDDGTNLYEYDALNRLVKVTRKSDSVVIGVHAWDAQSRRVLHTVTDGSNNENLRFFYKEGQLIEETDSEGSLVGQSVFGGMGERIESQAGFLSNRYLFEKLDGSIVSYADINKVVKAYYDYKAQGLVQLVTPIRQRYFTFGLFYASVNLSNSRHYLWQGVRIDFETGHYYGTRMYDPVSGRNLGRSSDPLADPFGFGNGYSDGILYQDGNKPVGGTGVHPDRHNGQLVKGKLELICRPLDYKHAKGVIAKGLAIGGKFVHCFLRLTQPNNLVWTFSGGPADKNPIANKSRKNNNLLPAYKALVGAWYDGKNIGPKIRSIQKSHPLKGIATTDWNFRTTYIRYTCDKGVTNSTAKKLKAKVRSFNKLNLKYDVNPYPKSKGKENCSAFVRYLWDSHGCKVNIKMMASVGFGFERIIDPRAGTRKPSIRMPKLPHSNPK